MMYIYNRKRYISINSKCHIVLCMYLEDIETYKKKRREIKEDEIKEKR